VADSAAAAAGIEVGDLIVAFDGSPISGGASLRVRVIGLPPGAEVEVEVIRDGERLTLSVVLGSGG
jgi:S1-C subfamily serine protease